VSGRVILIDYLYLKSFLAFIICCSVVSLGSLSPATAQNFIDDSEKIDYTTHHKTTVNGILMHYVIGGKGDPVVFYCMDGQRLGMNG
jgi:hypothetical protein